MTEIISAVTTSAAMGIGLIGDVGEAVVGSPLLLFMVVGIPLCGLGVGFFKRLISL